MTGQWHRRRGELRVARVRLNLGGRPLVLIQVPEILREKLGPDGAQALVDLLNEAGGRLRDDVLTLAEQRFRRHLSEEMRLFRQEVAREIVGLRHEFGAEIKSLRQEVAREIVGLREEFGGEVKSLRQEFGSEIKSVRQELADLRVEVASVKSDLTWRLFYFWTAHLVAIAGLLLAFFKLFG